MRLTISQVTGGPEVNECTLARTISRVQYLSKAYCTNTGDYGLLNVMFFLIGSVWCDIEFSGLRLAVFHRRSGSQQVQVAAPEGYLVWDSHTAQAFVLTSLRQAVEMGAEAFKGRPHQIDIARALGFIEVIENGLKEQYDDPWKP